MSEPTNQVVQCLSFPSFRTTIGFQHAKKKATAANQIGTGNFCQPMRSQSVQQRNRETQAARVIMQSQWEVQGKGTSTKAFTKPKHLILPQSLTTPSGEDAIPSSAGTMGITRITMLKRDNVVVVTTPVHKKQHHRNISNFKKLLTQPSTQLSPTSPTNNYFINSALEHPTKESTTSPKIQYDSLFEKCVSEPTSVEIPSNTAQNLQTRTQRAITTGSYDESASSTYNFVIAQPNPTPATTASTTTMENEPNKSHISAQPARKFTETMSSLHLKIVENKAKSQQQQQQQQQEQKQYYHHQQFSQILPSTQYPIATEAFIQSTKPSNTITTTTTAVLHIPSNAYISTNNFTRDRVKSLPQESQLLSYPAHLYTKQQPRAEIYPVINESTNNNINESDPIKGWSSFLEKPFTEEHNESAYNTFLALANNQRNNSPTHQQQQHTDYHSKTDRRFQTTPSQATTQQSPNQTQSHLTSKRRSLTSSTTTTTMQSPRKSINVLQSSRSTSYRSRSPRLNSNRANTPNSQILFPKKYSIPSLLTPNLGIDFKSLVTNTNSSFMRPSTACHVLKQQKRLQLQQQQQQQQQQQSESFQLLNLHPPQQSKFTQQQQRQPQNTQMMQKLVLKSVKSTLQERKIRNRMRELIESSDGTLNPSTTTNSNNGMTSNRSMKAIQSKQVNPLSNSDIIDQSFDQSINRSMISFDSDRIHIQRSKSGQMMFSGDSKVFRQSSTYLTSNKDTMNYSHHQILRNQFGSGTRSKYSNATTALMTATTETKSSSTGGAWSRNETTASSSLPHRQANPIPSAANKQFTSLMEIKLKQEPQIVLPTFSHFEG